MIRARDRRLLPLLLLNLLLLVLVVVQMRPQSAAPSEPATAELPPLPALADVTLPPLDRLAETVARPAFAPDRKPAPAKGLATPTSAWSGQIKVTGIVITPASRLAVVVRGDKAGSALRLVQGSMVDGWRVEAIRPEGVSFVRGEEQHFVPLVERAAPKKTQEKSP